MRNAYLQFEVLFRVMLGERVGVASLNICKTMREINWLADQMEVGVRVVHEDLGDNFYRLKPIPWINQSSSSSTQSRAHAAS